MAWRAQKSTPKDQRIIIHFDYDSFYCSVVERANPVLKSLPLGIQQKNIIVTCNAEARRRGLFKLQRLSEAKKACPELVLVSGEDLTRFRDASKELYSFFQEAVWSERSERLGLDEVYLDVSAVVDLNLRTLNANDLSRAFFQLSPADPTNGFDYEATHVAGSTFPRAGAAPAASSQEPWIAEDEHLLYVRLTLGSHLAQYLRRRLEEQHGFTCSVGISTSKLLSKLVGRLHKPRGQTTLLPPYNRHTDDGGVNNVIRFMDTHGVGQIPGIGWKLGQKLRSHMLGQNNPSWEGHFYSSAESDLSVKKARCFPDMSPQLMERVCAGPGFPRGIGVKVYNLLHGIDHSDVARARIIPRQLSIEDSYTGLKGLPRAQEELYKIAQSLLKRLRIDLLRQDRNSSPTEDGEAHHAHDPSSTRKGWMAYPRTLRLSTRPSPAVNPDGAMTGRISRSTRMPDFVLDTSKDIADVAKRLVDETILPLFNELHPPASGWSLSLLNLAATDMVVTAKEGAEDAGTNMNIKHMFQKQIEPSSNRHPPTTSPTPSDPPGDYGDDTGMKIMAAQQEALARIPGGYGMLGSEDLIGPRLALSSDDDEVAEDADTQKTEAGFESDHQLRTLEHGHITYGCF